MNFFADFLIPGHREWTQEGRETKATLILRGRKPNNPSSSTTQIHRLCVLQLMKVGAGWKCYCVFRKVKKGQCWVHSSSFSLSLSSIRNRNTHKSSNCLAKLTFSPQMWLHVFSRNWSLQSWPMLYWDKLSYPFLLSTNILKGKPKFFMFLWKLLIFVNHWCYSTVDTGCTVLEGVCD